MTNTNTKNGLKSNGNAKDWAEAVAYATTGLLQGYSEIGNLSLHTAFSLLNHCRFTIFTKIHDAKSTPHFGLYLTIGKKGQLYSI